MKRTKNWITMLLLPLLAILVPDLAGANEIIIAAGTFAGMAWIVNTLAQTFKVFINYNPQTHWKYLMQTVVFVLSIGLSFLFQAFGVGFLAEIQALWYEVVVISLLIGGFALGWYSLEVARAILQGLFPGLSRPIPIGESPMGKLRK